MYILTIITIILCGANQGAHVCVYVCVGVGSPSGNILAYANISSVI